MRELTANEQEAVNGGGWNWYEVGGYLETVGVACGAISYYCPNLAPVADAVGAASELAGLGCDAMGWICSHF